MYIKNNQKGFIVPLVLAVTLVVLISVGLVLKSEVKKSKILVNQDNVSKDLLQSRATTTKKSANNVQANQPTSILNKPTSSPMVPSVDERQKEIKVLPVEKTLQNSTTNNIVATSTPIIEYSPDAALELRVSKTSSSSADIYISVGLSVPGFNIRQVCPIDHGGLSFEPVPNNGGTNPCENNDVFSVYASGGALFSMGSKESPVEIIVLKAKSITKDVTLEYYLDIYDKDKKLINTVMKKVTLQAGP